MDRTSTAAISAAFILATFSATNIATALPLWCAPKIQAEESKIATALYIPEATNMYIAKPLNPFPFFSLKDRVYKSLDKYTPGHPAGDISIQSRLGDILAAKEIIKILPSGIAIPSIMRNDEGDIGMYWDNDDAYVDINIEPEGTFSFFSRIRSTGEEEFLQNISVSEIDANWAYRYLAPLSRDLRNAA